MIPNPIRIRFPQLAAPLSRLGATATAFVFALSASAHPGHGWRDADAQHLLTSPDHLAWMAIGGAVVCFGARFAQRHWPRRLLQSTGAGALVLAAVLWGIRP